jgi:DNA-binding GntR family transcriptional regulator
VSQAAEERRALVDKLASQLHARVLSGELPSGTRLRQEALAEEFGVSRTPVREALRKLEAGGLVELQPHRGAVVRGLSPREIRDAYEVRAALEALAARLAAERINREQLQRLNHVQGEFRTALERTIAKRRGGREVGVRELRRWANANDDFHQTIHEASGNEVLAGTLAQLARNFPRDLSRLVVSESSAMLEANVREHETILDALSRHDSEAAYELMQRHVARAGSLVTLRVEQRSAGPG